MRKVLAAVLAFASGLQPAVVSAAGGSKQAPVVNIGLPAATIKTTDLPVLTVPQALTASSPLKAADQVQAAASSDVKAADAQQAAPEAQSVQAAQAFDGAGKAKASDYVAAGSFIGAGVALSGAVSAIPAAPLAVEITRLSLSKKPVSAPRPARQRAADYIESGLLAVPVLIFAALETKWFGTSGWLGPAMAGTMAFASGAIHETLGRSRRELVGGWQASHDQRYRVGWNGQIRDVRGHKYGEDRYDEKVDGEVTPREQAAVRVTAALSGAAMLWMAGASMDAFVAYNLTLAALHGMGWYKDAKNPRPAPVQARGYDR